MRDPGFQPSIYILYIYIYTLVRFLSAREKETLISYDHRKKESLPPLLCFNQREGRDRRPLVVVIFLVSREHNTEREREPFFSSIAGRGLRTALNSRVSWEFGCIGAARVLAVTSVFLFEGNRWRRVKFL